MRRRRGITLLELLVTVAIMAIALGITILGAPRLLQAPEDDPTTIAQKARQRAIATAEPQILRIRDGAVLRQLTAMPNGIVLADSAFHIDRFTGRKSDATAR